MKKKLNDISWKIVDSIINFIDSLVPESEKKTRPVKASYRESETGFLFVGGSHSGKRYDVDPNKGEVKLFLEVYNDTFSEFRYELYKPFEVRTEVGSYCHYHIFYVPKGFSYGDFIQELIKGFENGTNKIQ